MCPAASRHPLTVIETQRLTLMLAPPEAAPRIVAYRRENWDFHTPWNPPRGQDELSVSVWRRRLESWAQEEREGLALRLMLFPRGDVGGGVLGTANFTQIVRGAFQACYLGYEIDYRAEGHGLMREALEGAVRHVFETMRLHRIMANHIPHNQRSAGLLKRLGFVPEGYARDYLFIDGAWQDHVLTSLTNPHPQAPA